MRATLTALLLLLILAVPAAGCQNSAAALPMVRTQASFDLDCADADIRVEQEIGGRFKAVGCGHVARYSTACDGLRCVVRGENETMVPWRDRPELETAPRP